MPTAEIWTRNPQPTWLHSGDRTDKPLNWPGAIIHHRAAHEAGHAVALLALGHPVDRIWTTDERTHGSQHAAQVDFADWQPSDFEALGGMLAAGERAANYWLHVTGRWTSDAAWSAERGADGDRSSLMAAITVAGLNEREIWDKACKAADKILVTRWRTVEALANALVASSGLALDRPQIEVIAARTSR